MCGLGSGFVGECLHYIVGWGKMGKKKTNKTLWSDWGGCDGGDVSNGFKLGRKAKIV